MSAGLEPFFTEACTNSQQSSKFDCHMIDMTSLKNFDALFAGIIAVAVSPNVQAAAVLSTTFYSLWFLSAGFVIPRPLMPGWTIWLYWINPVSYSIWGLVGPQLGGTSISTISPSYSCYRGLSTKF